MKQTVLKHEFIDHFPDNPAEGTVYISIPFATALHQCCCGCGNKVITPLAPTAWTLAFDGRTISLHPSVGNWSFPCQSHYWITNNRVDWARPWSREQVEAGRAKDRKQKERYYTQDATPARGEGFWRKLKKRF